MEHTEKIKVLLVDDHDLLRQGMKTMLATEPGIEVVGEANDGTGVLALIEKSYPDVVLIDSARAAQVVALL